MLAKIAEQRLRQGQGTSDSRRLQTPLLRFYPFVCHRIDHA
jgi:hypothetical protein